MDYGKRFSEGACVVCALAAIYELGDKHKWWPMNWPSDLSSYVLPICVLIACVACFYMSRRLTAQKRLTDANFGRYSDESREHGETKGALRDMTTYRDRAIKQSDEVTAERGNLQAGLRLAINDGREDREETVRWKQRTAELEQKLSSVEQIGRHATNLRLRFSGKTEKPSEVRADNIESWYTLWTPRATASSEAMGTLAIPENWAIFVVFKSLTDFRELDVSFSNPGFPQWETKQRTARFAIISIGGPIPAGDLEIYAKN
jgi:hypothetical protein